MSRSRRTAADDLRLAIECLPDHTKTAMLDGIRSNRIIVGAYSDKDGGICPMLAAHRCGGRTSFISFARAWDRYTNAKRVRRATRREVRVLESYLEMSLFGATGGNENLAAAISDHQASARDRRAREAAQGGSWGFLRERREERAAAKALELVEEREAELV